MATEGATLLHGGHPIATRIEEKLKSSLKVEHFEIVDTSGNCGGSYSVVIVSPDFAKKMTLARHKLADGVPLGGLHTLLNQILQDEIGQLHAFSQKTLTPEQWTTERSKA